MATNNVYMYSIDLTTFNRAQKSINTQKTRAVVKKSESLKSIHHGKNNLQLILRPIYHGYI